MEVSIGRAFGEVDLGREVKCFLPRDEGGSSDGASIVRGITDHLLDGARRTSTILEMRLYRPDALE
ncbi:MAG: hypothetical protein R6U92_05095 [Bacillota bacterium]